MTLTDARDVRDIPRDTITDLPLDDKRILARADWHESGGTITGDQLAERYGMSPRWGRLQVAAARSEAETRGKPAPAAASTERTPPVPRPAARTVPRGKTPARTPLPLLLFTGLAVAVVAAVCAVVSYIHIRDLALIAGMGGLSGWLPLGIDGLAVACTCSLLADRRHNEIPHALARAGLVLGIGGSLVANVLAVDPELVPLRAVRWVLAAYPPLALAVSAHMLFRMMGEHHR